MPEDFRVGSTVLVDFGDAPPFDLEESQQFSLVDSAALVDFGDAAPFDLEESQQFSLPTGPSLREHPADRRIVPARSKDGEEMLAVLIDLDFELYSRGQPTPPIIAELVDRYLLIALEALNRQPSQRKLIMLFQAEPETIVKVWAICNADPARMQAYLNAVMTNFGRPLPPLQLYLRAVAKQPLDRSRKSTRRGRVGEGEIRQLLKSMQEPGTE